MNDADKLLIATWAGAIANFLVAVVAVGIPIAQGLVQKRRDQSARLGLKTSRYGGQIALEVAYRPETQHVGLQARVTGRAPAHVIPTVRRKPAASIGEDWNLSSLKGIAATPATVVELMHFHNDPEGVFKGYVIVTGLGRATDLARATVVVEILSTADSRRIFKRKTPISPLNEDPAQFELSKRQI